MYMVIGQFDRTDKKSRKPNFQKEVYNSLIMKIESVQTKDFIRRFIEAYKKNYCLWDTSSDEYGDRAKRKAAYEELCALFSEIESTASIYSTKKKIEIIRNSYRREKRKVENSIREGARNDKVYTPSLWYYSLMDSFLSKLVQTTKEDDDVILMNNEDTQSETAEPPPKKVLAIPTITTRTSSLKRKTAPRRTSYFNSARNAHVSDRKLVHLATKVLENKDDDEFINFANNIGSQLKRLTEEQNILAQKLISDVIFHARTHNLNRDTRFSHLNSDRRQKSISYETVYSPHNCGIEDPTATLMNPLSPQMKTEIEMEESEEL